MTGVLVPAGGSATVVLFLEFELVAGFAIEGILGEFGGGGVAGGLGPFVHGFGEECFDGGVIGIVDEIVELQGVGIGSVEFGHGAWGEEDVGLGGGELSGVAHGAQALEGGRVHGVCGALPRELRACIDDVEKSF